MQIVAILSLAELINKGTIKIKKTKWLIITIFKERCIPETGNVQNAIQVSTSFLLNRTNQGLTSFCAATVIKKREILLAAEAKEGLSEEKDLSGVNREKCIREAGSVHNAILL